MERRHLQSLLLDKIRQLGGNVNWGMQLTAIEESGSKVEISFEHGQCAEVELLVGADGGWSTVRKHIIKQRLGG